MKLYADDMLVQSKWANDHLENLAEMFHILRKYDMKLNPLKCSFGVASGKFIGFMVNVRGIEANPTQLLALRDMRAPRTKNFKVWIGKLLP